MCKRPCKYRGECGLCFYHTVVGRTRLSQIYEQLGAKALTDEVRERMRPKNCEFFEKGKSVVRTRPIALKGSTPQRMSKRVRLEHELLRLHRAGKNDRQLAEELEVSKTTVRKWRLKNGLEANERPNQSRVDERKAMRLYEGGWNDTQISKALGVSVNTVWKWRHRRGLPSKYKEKINERR